ncbi:MAG: Gfo/Idh/MocA family oxidoreductase, partial [Treponemataceae bacterium]
MTRIGIIGAGGIGRKHIEALSGLDGAAISAVVDTDPAAARRAAGSDIPVFTDLAESLPLVDAVWI